ncbi:hypothetical protein ISN45_Aa02g005040 [Arabidopsis thaliana x Arabidopsis arenosa]|uniref:Uncharacterized protein n=1 Tax=Arabidopsis thaliana x Arabidopsis arenosa TaxID=1240361 RepID=A0A8T2BE70_9BRAS|nr:hypothetical protein ISN45_Aa04g012910 [Arabidopsis thaliana x Arabidopsis arenosa]KAG7585135.1 hypothetical protein ISN45_Aa02g005040 [Arabidopsis thaliana x Arabidopsis arenosa]
MKSENFRFSSNTCIGFSPIEDTWFWIETKDKFSSSIGGFSDGLSWA